MLCFELLPIYKKLCTLKVAKTFKAHINFRHTANYMPNSHSDFEYFAFSDY